MKIPILSLMVACVFLSARAADVDNGEDLHLGECTGCHDSSAYTRADRKVQSLARLGTQVRLCKDNLGVTWFDDEVDDVIAYLNKTYYHF